MRHYTYLHFDELDSTNSYLKRNYKNLASFSVVSCNHQSQGKGRLGRLWEDKNSESLLMSILIKDEVISDLSMITLLVGASIYKTLMKLGIKTKIKWPNDIMLNEKKTAGILCEMIVEDRKIKCFIIGIGLNLNNKGFSKELKNKASSLYLATNEVYDIEKIKKRIIKEFDQLFTKYLKHDCEFLKICKDNSYLDNQEIEVIYNGKVIKGFVKGIDDSGKLLIQKEKDVISISSGEVTLTNNYKLG